MLHFSFWIEERSDREDRYVGPIRPQHPFQDPRCPRFR
jgi:hypothetical protein